jgi:GNAT superfamily N-acetyltransferase
MDAATALETQLRAFREFVELLGTSSPEARVIELEGGIAGSLVPAVPGRSIANSVTYRDPSALAASLDRLAAIYDEAGIDAWTVWAPERDREAIAALEAAGHSLDGQPAAMVAELADLVPPEPAGLDWDAGASIELLGALNDRAYGHRPADGFASAFVTPSADLSLRGYRARVAGEPACVLATIDHAPTPGAAGPDCGVYFVATDPAHRGKGLATRLMAAALGEAHERGCATSTLQSSAMGQPIYTALGYRTWFRFCMYERRRAPRRQLKARRARASA